MRFAFLGIASLLLSGCVGVGPTPEQAAELQAVADDNSALARAHKITHVEAATRTNAAIERISGGQLSEQDRLIDDYRLALASQIDAGQVTVEVANYQMSQKIADIKEANRQRTAVALANIGQGLQAASDSIRASQAAQAASRPITCTTPSTYGNPFATVTTTCQ